MIAMLVAAPLTANAWPEDMKPVAELDLMDDFDARQN